METNKPRRWRRTLISVPFIADILKNGYILNFGSKLWVESEIPADAKLVGVFSGQLMHDVYFIFEHDSFDEIVPGGDIPTATIAAVYAESIQKLLDNLLAKHGVEDKVRNAILDEFNELAKGKTE